jgi:hypothetical protein
LFWIERWKFLWAMPFPDTAVPDFRIDRGQDVDQRRPDRRSAGGTTSFGVQHEELLADVVLTLENFIFHMSTMF